MICLHVYCHGFIIIIWLKEEHHAVSELYFNTEMWKNDTDVNFSNEIKYLPATSILYSPIVLLGEKTENAEITCKKRPVNKHTKRHHEIYLSGRFILSLISVDRFCSSLKVFRVAFLVSKWSRQMEKWIHVHQVWNDQIKKIILVSMTSRKERHNIHFIYDARHSWTEIGIAF